MDIINNITLDFINNINMDIIHNTYMEDFNTLNELIHWLRNIYPW